MKIQKRIIYDVSSIAKACYYGGTDKEWGVKVEFEGKTVHVNSWQHGREFFLNSVQALLREMSATPMDIVFVLEGAMGATIRRNIYPGYKARDPRPPEQLVQYQLLEEWIVAFFKRLGSVFVKRDGLEADDVIAFLAKNLKGERHVISNDGDMLILAGIEGVVVHYQSKVFDPNGDNPLGPFPLELNRLYKATVGDPSDTLKGAEGFGKAKFIDLFVACDIEGCQELERVIIDGDWKSITEDAEGFKPLQLILDSRDSVRRCYSAAGFFDVEIGKPGKELQWQPGMTLEKPADEHPDDRYDGWYQKRVIVHSGNFSELTASSVWAKIRQSPWVALDLETSVPPESDQWLREVNSQDEEDAPKGVDVIGSKIAGMGVTFGDNSQHTLYLTVDHKFDKNLTPYQLYLFMRKLLQSDMQIRFPVHSSAFELPVWFLNLIEFTTDDELFDCGFMPRVDDTIFMASYVDENQSLGLKKQAQLWLDYQQTTYEEVTQGRKMNEMTPQEVFAYGTDDTIVTSALRNFYALVMEVENSFDVYREVEINAAYLSAAAFVTGTKFSREEMRRQERADDKLYNTAWSELRAFLVKSEWEGVVMPMPTLEPASMKEIFAIVTGEELKTQMRKTDKIIAVMRETEDAVTLADLYADAVKNNGDMTHVEAYAHKFFKGEPQLNIDSPKQVSKLLYETLALPKRAINKPTKAAKAAGVRIGEVKTDALAIASAKFYDSETHADVMPLLDCIHTMRSVATRRKMFYKPYKTLPHWKTGMIHGSVGQCMTVTRRFAPNKPNTAQLPKEKGDFRQCYVAHHSDAAIVSLDFKGQELVMIADSSGDEAMTSCYVGENKRDMHHMTGLAIVQRKINPEADYDWFAATLDDDNHPMHDVVKSSRRRGKTTNFATEYGAQAAKLAATLMVPEEEAQAYLDAKLATFWRAEEWKKEEVIPQAKKIGYACTRMGVRRHLAAAFASDEWGIRTKAERQAVNFKIQGSCGEQTKLAMGRVWLAKLLMKYDVQFCMPVHDELVFSCGRSDLVAFVQELHALMVMPYADVKIPITSTIGIGHDYKNLIEIGETPDTAAIQAAINQLWPQHAANEKEIAHAA